MEEKEFTFSFNDINKAGFYFLQLFGFNYLFYENKKIGKVIYKESNYIRLLISKPAEEFINNKINIKNEG